MKTITINTTAITTAVATASTFTTKEGDFAGQIVIVGTEAKLQVKATNNYQTVVYKDIDFVSSDLTDTSFTAFSVNAKKLNTVLKATKNDEVSFILEEEQITVKSGRSKVKIQTTAVVQEISIMNQGEPLEISSHIGNFQKVVHAIDSNNPKFELNGALMQINNNILSIVSTDTRRMSVVKTPLEAKDRDIIIPKESISTIINLFGGLNTHATLGETQLLIETGSISFQTHLTSGKFPEFNRVIPKEYISDITISSDALQAIVKEASILDEDIILKFTGEELIVSDLEKQVEVKETFTTDCSIRFGVKAKSMLDFLAAANEENITIRFNSSNLPFVLQANSNFIEVVMPITIPEEEITQNTEDEKVQNAA